MSQLFLILAAIFVAVSIVCFAVPTAVFGASGFVWMTSGLLAWIISQLVGGWAIPLPARRVQ